MRSTGVGAPAAGASAWAHYRALAAEHRQQRLLVRLAVAGAAGVVVAGLTVWWAGPVVALAILAGQAAYARNRPGPATSWRRGALAERRTGRRLSSLDPGSYYVLHDRAVHGLPATNLDHLVIGLTGVYAIASRRWALGARLWTERRRLWVGRRPISGLPHAAVRTARVVADVLAAELDHDVPVSPVVAVHGARVPRGGLRYAGVEFQAVRRLPRHIHEHPVIFTSAQVATIAAAAERTLPPMLETLSYKMRPSAG